VPPSDLGWAEADVSRYQIEAPFALLVPGGAAHRPAKRWPATNYVKLARHLGLSRTTPVLLGAEAERQVLGDIAVAAPGAIDLCGQTSFEEIASLARAANIAIGNDTGPMHVIAAAGCPSIVLFSGASDPARTAPTGTNVAILRRPALSELPVATVVASLSAVEAARTKAERSSK
jgi:ADP-heptose:LPS heptosyltransferase